MKSIIKSLIALSIVIVTGFRTNAQVSVGVSVRIGPPLLPVYSQPFCPADGYIWVPGYWAYSEGGYYWVPGVWILPPAIGLLWTPGYWGFSGGYYGWNPGYWGRHVGFYGGINYRYGYGGFGYTGGMWRGNAFRYNTAVTNVNTTVVHNTYINRTIINNTAVVNNRYSFNGPGGVVARPARQERLAMREQHVQPTSGQLSHETSAHADRSQFASVNNGHPARLAMHTINNNNPANNPQNQNPSIQTNNSNLRVYQDQTAPNNNRGYNANNQLQGNAQNQVRLPNNSNGNNVQMRGEQMNARDVRNQSPHTNQPQMRGGQMNAQGHQFQPHVENMQRSNNRGGGRHGR